MASLKLYRMPENKLKDFNPDVLGIFKKKLRRNRQGLTSYLERRKNVEVSVSVANTVEGELPTPLPSGGYDMVMTSHLMGTHRPPSRMGNFLGSQQNG